MDEFKLIYKILYEARKYLHENITVSSEVSSAKIGVDIDYFEKIFEILVDAEFFMDSCVYDKFGKCIDGRRLITLRGLEYLKKLESEFGEN
jgi:hypothetical protein